VAGNRKKWLRSRHFLLAASAATIGAIAFITMLILSGSQTDAAVFVQHRGATIVVQGHGYGGNMGYLPAGQYRVSVERRGDGGGGCAIGLRLTGADGVEWLRMIFYTNRVATTAITKELPGQIYNISTEVYFGDGLGGSPRPAADCSWAYDFTPL
jgi:hypothetical protein